MTERRFLMKIKYCISLILTLIVAAQSFAGLCVSAEEDGTVFTVDNKDIAESAEMTEKTDGQGTYGGSYGIAESGELTLRPEVTKRAYYKLYLRWPSNVDGLTEKLKVSVTDSDGEVFETERDQTINGGYWVFIGTYYMYKNGTHSITIKSEDGKTLAFDAMHYELSREAKEKAKPGWFTDVEDEEPEEVITGGFTGENLYSNLLRITSIRKDNKEDMEETEFNYTKVGDELVFDTTAECFTTNGTWKKEESESAYNKEYLSDGSVDDDYLQVAQWQPEIVVHGKYEVYLHWPDGDERPDLAKVIVENFNGKDTTHTVDQTKNGGEWNLVDTFEFQPGTGNKIILEANSYGYTAADAVKLKLVSTDDLTPIAESIYDTDVEPYVNGNPDKYNIVLDDNNKFFLTKNGEVHNINGVCTGSGVTDDDFQKFVAAGGNMIRTYDVESLYSGILDTAYKNGVGVMVGIWIPTSDAWPFESKVRYQEYIDRQIRAINIFKDHPAVVMWSVNNESEGSDKNGEVYAMIEDITRYIKSVDPYHPVATVFAGNGTAKQEKLMTLAPSIDILGVNSYEAIYNVYPTTEVTGWRGPILVGEYGPDGTWAAKRTSWGVALEQLNAEKADLYRTRHIDYIMTNNKGIGGFAFCLPNAIGAEGTLTWYAFMFNNMRTPIMDEMQYAWTGQYADNVSPRISSITVNGKNAADNVILSPDGECTVEIVASDRDNDELNYHFEIWEEINSTVADNLNPRCISAAENESNSSKVSMKLPSVPGYYRIYGYVTDDHGNVCADNFPIYVKQTSQNLSAAVKDPDAIAKLLDAASKEFEDNGAKANINVNIMDLLNGMRYPAEGTAVIESDKNTVHIKSVVDYTSGGMLESEVYYNSSTAKINYNGSWKNEETKSYYDVNVVYGELAENKELLENMLIDSKSDNKYTIISGNVCVPALFNEAVRGVSSAEFTDVSSADEYSIEIYVSKETGRIEKTIVVLGYMQNVDEGRHQRLEYTYEYDYSGKVTVVMP